MDESPAEESLLLGEEPEGSLEEHEASPLREETFLKSYEWHSLEAWFVHDPSLPFDSGENVDVHRECHG